MSTALSAVPFSDDLARATRIWANYPPRWQAWNITRIVARGVALLPGIVGRSA